MTTRSPGRLPLAQPFRRLRILLAALCLFSLLVLPVAGLPALVPAALSAAGLCVLFHRRRLAALQARLEAASLRAEELERYAYKLVRLNSAARLSAGLAHEVSQPLATAGILLQTLILHLQREAPGDHERLGDLAGRAETQVQQAAHLLAQLRGLVGDAPAQPATAFSLQAALSRVQALVTTAARLQSVELRWALDLADGRVLADRLLFEHACLILLNNALDAVADVPHPRVVFAARLRGATLRVSVLDNGRGIAPDRRAQLFQPSMSDKDEGLGLGLFMCRSFVESWHGNVFVHSGRRGTLFGFTLPLVQRGEGA